ncbi:MAG TPA: serine hydrolase domain-containing protein [Vicinamibacterales bacterium]|nr:serine hydrolase domain-containing protein [Vicinamibacterales bacterium]
MSHATRRLVLLLAAFVMLGGLTPLSAQDRPVVSGEAGRTLDEYLSRLERFGFTGGALAVRGKDVLLSKSYGLADRARRIPLATDSVYNLGSITKQFTAAAILALEMQGKLTVTDLASTYLDGVPADKSAITLHHLLTHSSGLESDFSPTDYDPVGREEYVRRALQSTLLFKPGDGYEYSNAGYSLLAAIVEIVSGQPYEVYLTDRVLKPAGMRETGYKLPKWAPERVAHGYLDSGEDWGTILQRIQEPDAPHWMLRGNGGLHTTLGDMLAWHRALDTDAVLSKGARAKYFAPYVAEGPRGLSHYAYGWAVSKSARGTTVVQHNGGNGVYVAEFLRFPDEDAMLFVTSTDTTLTATPVVEVLEGILFGGKAALPPRVVDVAPDRVQALAGEWRLPEGGTLTLAADGPALEVTPAGQEAFSALASASPAQAARLADLSTRTANIAAKSFAGDVTALHEAMGGGMNLEQMRAQEADMMRDRESRLGKYKGSAAVGAVPRDADTVRVFVRLDFEKRSVYNVYLWGPKRILGLRGTPVVPAFRYLPTGDREFAAFSLDGGGVERRFRFVDRDGQTRLILGPPEAPVEASRSK